MGQARSVLIAHVYSDTILQRMAATYAVVDLASMLVAYLVPRLRVVGIPHRCGEARA